MNKEIKFNDGINIKNHIKLNIMNELSGSGAGLILIKELGYFSNMCLYSLVIFQLAFGECFECLYLKYGRKEQFIDF